MNIFNRTTKLDALRERSFLLSHLPDTVHIPPQAGIRDEATKPIEVATLDDIAFALLGLQEKSSEIYRKIEALRAVYELARKSGATGAEIAFNVMTDVKGGSR